MHNYNAGSHQRKIFHPLCYSFVSILVSFIQGIANNWQIKQQTDTGNAIISQIIPNYPCGCGMTWRIHLTNRAIRELHILQGKPQQLAVWTQRNRIEFYDMESGVLLGHRTIEPPPNGEFNSEAWQIYLATLTDLRERAYLPVVPTSRGTIHTTDDGKLHLFRVDDSSLVMMTGGKLANLPVAGVERFIALDLDRALGMVAALDNTGKLHIYQQDIRIGDFDVGLEIDPLVSGSIVISNGGGMIYATDGRQIIVIDTGGVVLQRVRTHYNIRQIACSPGGGMVVTSDNESGVIRVYRGDTLIPTHQRFAVDLIAEAQQLQLLADLPPTSVSISALTAGNRGKIGFAMPGVVCMTDVSQMTELPRPQALL